MKNNLMLSDESMNVILDAYGDPLVIPDDFYDFYNPLLEKEWVVTHRAGELVAVDAKEDHSESLRSLANANARLTQMKIERLDLAYGLYKNAGGTGGLRHPVAVFENYVPEKEEGFVVRYFIFKEDNNGTTYRIIDRKQLRQYEPS